MNEWQWQDGENIHIQRITKRQMEEKEVIKKTKNTGEERTNPPPLHTHINVETVIRPEGKNDKGANYKATEM